MGCLVVLASLLAEPAIATEPHAVGDTVAPIRFETQFGDEVAIDASIRLVLVTHDMDAGSIAKAVLGEHTAATLAARGAVYVADVSKMPGFVSRMIAIPRMRRRPYPVLLDRDGETSRLFPMASGAVASGLGYAIWYAALNGLSGTRAATVQLSVPVIAAFGGVVLLSEAITFRLLVASAATLGGVAIVLAQRAAK